MITVYSAGDAARGFFPGYRSISVFISNEQVAEIPVIGDSIAAQQASLKILGQAMQGGVDALKGVITDVLDAEGLGLPVDNPAIASTLMDTLFAESDCLTYEATVLFNLEAAGDISLLDAIAETGAALLEFLLL